MSSSDEPIAMTARDGAAVGPPERDEDAALLEIVDRARSYAAQIGRDDLAERLGHTRERLLDPHVRVLVVGQFKQGKSKLVNALVNAPACPIDDDVATSVPTTVGYAETPSAAVFVRNDEGREPVLDRVPIPLDDLPQYVSERGNPDNTRGIVGAEVLLPREILKGGLRLVDSPGVGGVESTRSLSTLAAIPTAHAVIVVSDASQEYTEPEMQFVRHAMRISPNIAAVITKIDVYPEWREIEQLDRSHLEAVGEVPVFSVSNDLRLLAAGTQDPELNRESGFPALVSHLRTGILGEASTLNRRSAVHDLRSVGDQLTLSIQTELNALLHPEDTPRMIAQLEEAKARADEFRSRSSRWQVSLADGVADLIADTEHDLRDRLRAVQREAEAAIDEGDPGPIWDQIVEWLDGRVSEAVSETFVWTNERSRWLTEEVAVQFSADQRSLPELDVGRTEGLLQAVEGVQTLDDGQLGTVEKIYIGVRGSYGGVLMTGLATSLVGMALINPLSLLVGVLVGRRAYREDMTARLTRRQLEAKNHVRRYIDEVVFQVGKQLKDRLRLVQRTARDHFGAIADELHRSLSESVLAAKQAAATYSADRDERVKLLQHRLQRIEALQRDIRSLDRPAERLDAVRR